MPHLTDILRSMDVSISNILHAVSGEHQFFSLSTSHKKTAPVTWCGLCLHRYSSRIYFLTTVDVSSVCYFTKN